MLNQIKDYLKITWPEEDENLSRIIERGKDYLNGIAGNELDFENDSLANQLLLDYSRYVYNHAFELFETNFRSELLKLSMREGMKSFAPTDSETSP